MKLEEHIAGLRQYCHPSYVDQYDEEDNIIPGEWRNYMMPQHIQPVQRVGANRGARGAIALRDNIAEYFLSDAGQVYWQWAAIHNRINT